MGAQGPGKWHLGGLGIHRSVRNLSTGHLLTGENSPVINWIRKTTEYWHLGMQESRDCAEGEGA